MYYIINLKIYNKLFIIYYFENKNEYYLKDIKLIKKKTKML